MRVKICGITNVDDAVQVAEAGVDAIGLNFYQPSPRYVTIAQAADIAHAVGPFVTLVGLFVNAEKAIVDEAIARLPLHMLQFHGDESPAFCEQFPLPYMKAIRMRDDLDLDSVFTQYATASAILLDAYKAGVPGGTGETFDWKRVPKTSPLAIVLAGGLDSDNVQEAIRQTRPYAVDVSGGVELSPSIEDKPRVKDLNKVTAFINNAKANS